VTTTFFLVRHAAHALLGRTLVGRMSGIVLGEPGLQQARAVALRLAAAGLDAVQTSPRERAVETAEPIAASAGLRLEVAAAIDEIDVGAWTGRSFDELRGDPRWTAWNTARSVTCAPGGESMLNVQARVVGHLDQLRAAYPDGRVAMVSHGDVIKAAVLYYLGLPVDAVARVEVGPASVSTLCVGDWGARLLSLNEAPAA
jgi:probable phosphoglycerate mutase